MATFLELAQGVGTDSGLISRQNIPTTVAGATGKWAEIVAFTAKALQDIQRARNDWEFNRASFSQALTIGKADYLPAELGITSRFARFANDIPASCYRPMHCYDPALGTADDQNLVQISPECWSMIYGRGSQSPTRPTEYALGQGKLLLGTAPDKAYVLAGDYWKAPQALSLDADVPDLPEQFHDVVKWRAIVKVSGKDGAFTDRLVAQAEYSSMYRQMVNEQTRPVEMGDSLA
jgi:hypothetical protein